MARFLIATNGSTVSFSIARRAIGNPSWFRFLVAARETECETGGGVDMAPDRGTFRYAA